MSPTVFYHNNIRCDLRGAVGAAGGLKIITS